MANDADDEYQRKPWGTRHPGVAHFEPLFDFAHLRAGAVRNASIMCAVFADRVVTQLPDSPELAAGLRKLLEAKDCFVRVVVLAGKSGA